MNIVLNVEGMSCGHCVSAITAAVQPLPGVTGVEVDLSAGTVTVSGTPDTYPRSQSRDCRHRGLRLRGSMSTLTLDVGGMTCASCAARIEKRLNRIDGVHAP